MGPLLVFVGGQAQVYIEEVEATKHWELDLRPAMVVDELLGLASDIDRVAQSTYWYCLLNLKTLPLSLQGCSIPLYRIEIIDGNLDRYLPETIFGR
jgi:hypothetical protein